MSHPPIFYARTLDAALWKASQELGRSPAELEYRDELLEDGSHRVQILGLPLCDGEAGERARRRAVRIAAMAQELADKAVQVGSPLHVEAVLSPDRRSIHTALAGRHEVRTDSDGAGAFRKLVITPRCVSETKAPG